MCTKADVRRPNLNLYVRALIRLLPDPPHMGEAESALIFQAVAERAVEADMGQPDHGDRKDERRGGAKAGRHHRHRREIAVRCVVDEGAETGSRQVGRKAEVRHEEQQAVNPPVAVPDIIKQRHTDKER